MRPITSVISACISLAALSSPLAATASAPKLPDTVLYGVAYYDEYAPVDRVDEDAKLMKAAGITVVRIAESTWGTLEPRPGEFDFSHVDRMLAAFNKQGIKVIVGTPTYAIPAWLAKQSPDVLVVTKQGRAEFGRRQNMDITNPDFRAAAQRVIIALIDHVKDNPAVIGYQVDNETKAYGTSGPNVQAAFVGAMKKRFETTDALNNAFGLNYWSNRINSWDEFPSVNGSINASLTNAFAEFQRGLVNDYLGWQSGLVRAHARPDQFITQNFDLDWVGYSYGLQPEVNHWQAARSLDVAGIDIYHPGQSHLTGTEIAFGGDLARSIRNGQNYLVIEAQANGMQDWTPYPGQLRLQAFSHLASGANMLEYWHWATTATGVETNWRGLLAQDYQPGALYDEAQTIGADLKRLGPTLVDLKKHNRVAIYVSNTALSGFDAFKMAGGRGTPPVGYNQVLRGFYDALYRMNVEVDLISPDSDVPLDRYKLIVVPGLYAASDAEIGKLNAYAKAGGHLLYTFRSGFSDENTKVRYASQPGAIAAAAGVTYQQFTIPENVSLKDNPFGVSDADNKARWWMEFLKPTTASVVARYSHPAWDNIAAMTRNTYGKGQVSYLGFMPSDAAVEKILLSEVDLAGVAHPAAHYPLIVRSGILKDGRSVRYLFNYSGVPQAVTSDLASGVDLLSGKHQAGGQPLELGAWGVAIMAGEARR